MKKFSRILIVASLIFTACSSEDEGSGNSGVDTFDRGAMLENWADNIIVPSFDNFKRSTQQLEDPSIAFTSNPSEEKLIALRSQFESSYLNFQPVPMFVIG